MKKRDFAETLTLLCQSREEFRKGGAFNSAAIGAAVGIHQATIHRMLDGQSGEPSPANAKKLCKYFGVTREQLIGEQPIPWIDSQGVGAYPRLVAALQRAESFPEEDLEALLVVIEGLEARRRREKDKQ